MWVKIIQRTSKRNTIVRVSRDTRGFDFTTSDTASTWTATRNPKKKGKISVPGSDTYTRVWGIDYATGYPRLFLLAYVDGGQDIYGRQIFRVFINSLFNSFDYSIKNLRRNARAWVQRRRWKSFELSGILTLIELLKRWLNQFLCRHWRG